MPRLFQFNELQTADLIVDASYKGGMAGNAGDDPIHKLLGCGTQGGFRYIGPVSAARMVVIYSSFQDPDWPDFLDEVTGQSTYWGDNKRPGHSLHDTPRKGNELLRRCFEALHAGKRDRIPPFFVFNKGSIGRDAVFRGLAVPGAAGLPSTEDLVAIWKSKMGERFQNYRATFTIMNVPLISRTWLADLKNGNTLSQNCPNAYRRWVESGIYSPLRAEKTIQYRTKQEQLPHTRDEREIIESIHRYFQEDPYLFEKCAGELVRMMDSNIVAIDVTRPWLDGGRDALGKYRIGLDKNSIEVEFALEAKCWKLNNAVRVRDTSRLIARLRHRQFGIFVTTSFVHRQAYEEIKEDQHPVIIVCAADMVRILKEHGYGTPKAVEEWLQKYFPH
jgi:hypothetical protein